MRRHVSWGVLDFVRSCLGVLIEALVTCGCVCVLRSADGLLRSPLWFGMSIRVSFFGGFRQLGCFVDLGAWRVSIARFRRWVVFEVVCLPVVCDKDCCCCEVGYFKYSLDIYAISLEGFPEHYIDVIGILKNQDLRKVPRQMILWQFVLILINDTAFAAAIDTIFINIIHIIP